MGVLPGTRDTTKQPFQIDCPSLTCPVTVSGVGGGCISAQSVTTGVALGGAHPPCSSAADTPSSKATYRASIATPKPLVCVIAGLPPPPLSPRASPDAGAGSGVQTPRAVVGPEWGRLSMERQPTPTVANDGCLDHSVCRVFVGHRGGGWMFGSLIDRPEKCS